MGTYYTELFEKGDVSFEEFVWRRARMHGPLIHMRDDSHDARIRLPANNSPDESSYYQQDLEQTMISRIGTASSSLEEIQQEIDTQYERSQREAKEGLKLYQLVEKRMQAMLEKFEKWSPPTPNHEPLRDETIESLKDGLKRNEWYIEYHSKNLLRPKMDAETYKVEKLKYLDEHLAYLQKKIEGEANQVDHAAEWILTLDQSVPAPEYLKGFTSRKKETNEDDH